MPYDWNRTEAGSNVQELHLWPHQSLRPKGYAWFLGITFTLMALPLVALLGTPVLWGVLPFVLLAVGGIWFALDRNRRDTQILEILTLTGDMARLVRLDPHGERKEWACNRYWVHAEMHDADGPVPHYVTLHGAGREVEIGAFLSEDERLSLYDDLNRRLRRSG
ncbi:DUF2244 domain-containing protein [Pontibaca methylaminivorans]|uniref:DUF2244 domain-containing protein n=1 Tax=Pontibaca methylaminivorans TaxID=515897 RepID=UPI002FDB55B9